MAAVPSLAELMHHGLGLRDHAAEESPHPLSFWVPPCGLADDVPEVSSGAPPVGDEACGPFPGPPRVWPPIRPMHLGLNQTHSLENDSPFKCTVSGMLFHSGIGAAFRATAFTVGFGFSAKGNATVGNR